MRNKFSTAWLSSTQPRKQRKYLHNAPLHLRHKFLSANLAKVLREKYGKRSIPIRKGDEVLVMRGSFKKKKGKVADVNMKTCEVIIEGIQRSKKDGAKVNVKFKPCVLQIQVLNLDDKERSIVLNRKAPAQSPSQSSSTKPKEKKNAP